MKKIQDNKIHPSKLSKRSPVREESNSLSNTRVGDLFNQDKDAEAEDTYEEPILKSKKGDSDAMLKQK